MKKHYPNVNLQYLDECWVRLHEIPDVYAQVEINGHLLVGDRAFEPRFETLRTALDFTGRRVLDCGCHLGLFSTFLTIEEGAICTAFDREKRFLSLAEGIAAEFRAPVRFFLHNLNYGPPWPVLSEDYDVALLLNVWRYLNDMARRRVVAQLSRVPFVFVETQKEMDQSIIDSLLAAGDAVSTRLDSHDDKRDLWLIARK